MKVSCLLFFTKAQGPLKSGLVLIQAGIKCLPFPKLELIPSLMVILLFIAAFFCMLLFIKTVAGPSRQSDSIQLIYILKISVHGRTILTDNSALISLNNFKLTYNIVAKRGVEPH